MRTGRPLGPSKTLDDLFARAIPIPFSGCWAWLGDLNNKGYARVWQHGRRRLVHRMTYILTCGDVPEGKELDHLCRVRCCINPDHLEAVAPRVNVERGTLLQRVGKYQLARTHCPSGQPYSGENLFVTNRGERRCRTCMRAFKAKYRNQAKELAAA